LKARDEGWQELDFRHGCRHVSGRELCPHGGERHQWFLDPFCNVCGSKHVIWHWRARDFNARTNFPFACLKLPQDRCTHSLSFGLVSSGDDGRRANRTDGRGAYLACDPSACLRSKTAGCRCSQHEPLFIDFNEATRERCEESDDVGHGDPKTTRMNTILHLLPERPMAVRICLGNGVIGDDGAETMPPEEFLPSTDRMEPADHVVAKFQELRTRNQGLAHGRS